MMPLSSVLAIASDLSDKIPYIIGGVCGAILLIAFIIGFCKGWRKVGWGVCAWLVAAAAFILVQKYLGETVLGFVKPILSGAIAEESVLSFAAAFITVLACIIAALLFYGLFSLLFRPKAKWVRKKKGGETYYGDGVEYDDEMEEYDDLDEDNVDGDEFVRKQYKPNFFGRLFGGLICVANTLAVVGMIAVIALLVVNATELKNGALAPLFEFEFMPKVIAYASRYGMDVLLVGVLFLFACGGREKGFVESFRKLFIGVGIVAAIALCFYVPFSAFATEGFIGTFIERCTAAMGALGLSGDIGGIVGKILSGVLLCIAVVIVMLIVNWLLKKAADGIENSSFLSAIDGAFSAVVYLVIGVIVCVLVWAVWYVLAHYGILYADKLFAEDSILSGGLYNVCEVYLGPIITDVTSKISGLLSSFGG